MKTWMIAIAAVCGLMLSVGPGWAGGESEGADAVRASRKDGPELIRTAIVMQRHTEIVSTSKISEIGPKLARKGYTLVGKVIEGGRGSGLQAYVAVGGGHVVVAFRGTKSDTLKETIQNIKTDAKFVRMAKLGFSKKYSKIKVHKGFYDEYAAVRDEILSRVRKHKGKPIYVTGFSLGGALASLCALDLKERVGGDVHGFFLGNPRVGGEEFRAAMGKSVGKTLRVALNLDIVPKVPGITTKITTSRYQHHSPQLLQLYPNGVRVPANKLDTRIRTGTFKQHDRDKYRDALRAQYEACKKDQKICDGGLSAMAKKERSNPRP